LSLTHYQCVLQYVEVCCSVSQCVTVLRWYHCALSLTSTHMSQINHTHAHMSTMCTQFCADVVSLRYTIAVTAAPWCNVLPCVDVYCHVLLCVPVCCCVLPWCVVVCCRLLQCVAVCCRVLQFQHCVHAPLRARSDRQRVCHCNTLQHTATHCNTL